MIFLNKGRNLEVVRAILGYKMLKFELKAVYDQIKASKSHQVEFLRTSFKIKSIKRIVN